MSIENTVLFPHYSMFFGLVKVQICAGAGRGFCRNFRTAGFGMEKPHEVWYTNSADLCENGQSRSFSLVNGGVF